MALEEWLTESVGKQTWAGAGDIDVYNRVLSFVTDVREDVEILLQEWWSSP